MSKRIRFDCTECQERLKVPPQYVGRKGKCPECGTINVIPDLPPTEPEEPAGEAEALEALATVGEADAAEKKPVDYAPATEKQLKYLAALGVRPDGELTKAEARDLIEEATSDGAGTGLISERQTTFITELGGVPVASMSHDQAGEYIGWLLGQQIDCPECGSHVSAFLGECPECAEALPDPGKSNRVPRSIYP